MLNFYVNTNPKDWTDTVGALAPAIVGLLSLVVACISILFTRASINQQKCQLEWQKQQWLNDIFIKKEAEVLLKAKELFPEAEDAIIFFSMEYLFNTNFKYPMSFKPISGSGMSWDCIVRWHNAIKELYNLFVINENIFVKHKLDKNLDYLRLFLYLLRVFPKNAFTEFTIISKKYKEDSTGEIIEKDGYIFTVFYKMIYFANAWFNGGECGDGAPLESFVELVDTDMINKVNDLLNSAIEEIGSMGEYLNKITIFNDGQPIEKPKYRQKWYFSFEDKDALDTSSKVSCSNSPNPPQD